MRQRKPVFFAVLAAALYAVNSPFSKLLLENLSPTMLAALLYLGAGTGLFLMGIVQKRTGAAQKEMPLTRRELPWTIGMVALDIAAPISLMAGLKLTSAANASLLNNFEIVATSLIAFSAFKEKITNRREHPALGGRYPQPVLLRRFAVDPARLHFLGA